MKRYDLASIVNGKDFYSISKRELEHLGFLRMSNLYLLPKDCYYLIPDDTILQHVGFYLSLRSFFHFKYEEDYFANNITYKYERREYLHMAINKNYTYDELIIKLILE